MDKIKAIIFDMDGVIVDSQAKHRSAELATCYKFGLNVPAKIWPMFYGWKIEEIFSYLDKKYGRNDLPIKKMAEYKNELFLKLIGRGVKRIPGAVNFIKNTRKYFLKTAVATSSKKVQREMIFKKLRIEKYFDILVQADNIKRGKPDPEIYSLAVKKIKFKPKECLVIEDAPNGVLSAKRAGCLVAGILTGFTGRELKKAGADYIINNYQELEKIVKKITL